MTYLSEIGYLSDYNFLEQYFEDEFDDCSIGIRISDIECLEVFRGDFLDITQPGQFDDERH